MMEKKYFKVIIAGGRNYENYKLLKFKMNEILKNVTDDIIIVSGKAKGADNLGEIYAREKGYRIKEFPAEWDNFDEPCIIKYNNSGKAYNALAGHNRNADMVNYADAAVYFWDGRSTGTANCIKLAKEKGIKIRIIKY